MPPVTDQRAQGNARVDGLAFVMDGTTPRLEFPHAQIDNLRGEAAGLAYGATELVLEQLTGLLAGVSWTTEAASAGKFWVRDAEGRFEMTIDRIELPHGLRVTQSAAGGVELVAPHVSLSEVRVSIPDLAQLGGPPGESAPASPAEEPTGLRQEQLRFLDAVTGEIAFRIAVVLDLPVIGHRTLDQAIKLTVEDGAFNFEKLASGLSWLEGQFLDIGIEGGRFRMAWGVPLFGTNEIVSFALDSDASAMAERDRIPLRSLFDYRMAGGNGGGDGGKNGKSSDKQGRLKSLTIGDIDVKLSLVAPHNVEVAGGTVRFGGDDAPGIVDLTVHGAMTHPPAPGAMKAQAGAVDMTVKDLNLGGLQVTADRITVGPVDTLVVTFDGFEPRALVAVLHRVTATNLALTLGSAPIT